MDNLNSIKKIDKNEFMLRELVAQLKSALGVLPFVGAGLSIPFGFKGWQDFLLLQAERAGIGKKIRQRIKQGEYEEAAQDLLTALAYRDFQDALLDEYGDHKLDGITLDGTVTYLPRLASGPVITTNFDRVLEKAFEDCGARFEGIVWGAKIQVAQKAVYQNKRYLLKLHGDVEDRTDRILTLSEYRKNYGMSDASRLNFKKPLPYLLQTLLTGRPVLFLGCSLKNDRVVKFLKHIANTNPDLPHYAVVEHPGTETFSRMRKYFAEHGIRPIWYPKDKHEFVERIVRYLSETISDMVPPKSIPQWKGIVSRMKATEALEVLIKQHQEIASFLIIKYKDKLRLRERVHGGLVDDPALYLSQAAIHNDADDEEKEIPRAALREGFWTRLFKEVQDDFVLAVSSRVKLKNGKFSHIPLMDFKCAPTSENVDIAKEGFRKIGQTHGVLLNSGKSFHFYGQTLMSEKQWRAFLGHSLLLSDVIDTRYVGHALINNECRLRISTTRLNPFIPTVVDIF
ncbi:MAG: SIR2 family NAD-dependent protein deacylase [Pyrinomonadaceae bacterium]